MTQQKQTRTLTTLTLLSIVGFALSSILSLHYYEIRNGSASFHSLCNLGKTLNCDVIAASPHAELAFGFPLSSFSAGYFIAVTLMTLIARGNFWRRDSLRALFWTTSFGSLVSIFYLAIMAMQLKTFCTYCIGVDLINWTSLALVLYLKPELRSGPPHDFQKWKSFMGIFAASFIVVAIGFKGLDASQFDSTKADALAEEILKSPVAVIQTQAELPSFGPADAPVTLVEFSDFQCPFCRLGAQSLQAVLNRYPHQVRVVFKNFPLDGACNRKVEHSMHPYACTAAKTAYCANQQGKFSAVYEKFFEEQDRFARGQIDRMTEESGIESSAMKSCIENPATLIAVQKDIEEAITLGVQSTPTFFINGHKVEGALTPPVWAVLIDKILNKK